MRDGKSDAQIAQSMGLSTNTIRHHLRAVGKKFGTTDRTAIVVRAILVGEISLPGPEDLPDYIDWPDSDSHS